MQQHKLIGLLAVVLSTASFSAPAQDYRHQLGIRLGSVEQVVATGFTYRYHIDDAQAIEGIFNLNTPLSFGLLYERFIPFTSMPNLRWFYGAGGFAGFGGTDVAGALGILGLDYQFPQDLPINVSVDWKPELTVVNTLRFRASTVAVSIRLSLVGKPAR